MTWTSYLTRGLYSARGCHYSGFLLRSLLLKASIYIYIYLYTYTYTGVCINIHYVCLYTHTHIMFTYIQDYMHTYIHTCIPAYMHTCLHACMHNTNNSNDIKINYQCVSLSLSLICIHIYICTVCMYLRTMPATPKPLTPRKASLNPWKTLH